MSENQVIDLRSDTITRPDEEMRKAMAGAEVGDDVYREDPTVLELEEKVAEILGKEAALYFPSGTMANQTAILVHTEPGQEIILGKESHIFYYEAGGAARLSGLQTRILDDESGCPDPDDVEKAIRGEDIHYPPTGLICLENTHNRAGGRVVKPEIIEEISSIASENDLPLHLDGARFFNAVQALGCSPEDLAGYFDSVMCCLSKGLGAPVGSMLAGKDEFIEKAIAKRKLLGGGMRQVGVLAAAGLKALENVDRLAEDHRLASELAKKIDRIDWPELEVDKVNTNFVILKYEGEAGAEALRREMENIGLLANAIGPSRIRLVTHLDINEQAIEDFAAGLKQLAGTIS